MRTAKTLVRLGGCPGWSVFAGRTLFVLVFSCRGSYIQIKRYGSKKKKKKKKKKKIHYLYPDSDVFDTKTGQSDDRTQSGSVNAMGFGKTCKLN